MDTDMEKLYLTGMMGCGKSVLGKRLAQKLEWRFIDLDALIEKKEGKKITEIFAAGGEELFRNIETETLKEVAGRNEKIVVSCGGGIVLREENVHIMKDSGRIVLIRRNIETIVRTINLDKRPVLKNDAENIRRIYEQRKQNYETAGDIEIDNNGSIEETISTLLEILKSL